MIGYLQGKILDTDGKKAILLTSGGIGYEINYAYFIEKEKEIALFVHHHVSENDESLWGFNTLEDKKMFELLKTVNKVGSSKAYPLVAIIGTQRVIEAVMFDRPEVLSEAQGIGKKMAEQIILSLRDKIEKFRSVNITATFTQEDFIGKEPSSFDEKVYTETLMALDSLGYKDKDVSALVRNCLKNGLSQSADIIKSVLRDL